MPVKNKLPPVSFSHRHIVLQYKYCMIPAVYGNFNNIASKAFV